MGCVRIVQQGLTLPEELMVAIAQKVGILGEAEAQPWLSAGGEELPPRLPSI